MNTLLCLAALLTISSGARIMRALTGQRSGDCPAPSGMVGICIFDPNVNCLADSECPAGQKCCSEGCGKICKDIVTSSSAILHAGSCPAPTHEVGLCWLVPNHCSGDADCTLNEKCCPEGCNRVCKPAIITVG